MSLMITFEDREFAFDKQAITVDEWRELKRKYKMTPKQFDETIGDADPDSSTFLYWVMLRQNGPQSIPLGDQLKPDIIALNRAIAAALDTEAQAEPEEKPDPTPAGSLPATTPSSGSAAATSAGSETSTSSGSPTSVTSDLPKSGD